MIFSQVGIATAAVDGYVVKSHTGEVLLYDYTNLKTSLTNSLVYGENSDQAKLWMHFMDAKASPGEIVALNDDQNGFIDFEALKSALMQSLINGTSFSVDDYTESSNAEKAANLPPVLKEVTLQNGTIAYTDYNNGSSLPSFTLTAIDSGLIGTKTVTVTLLNTENDTDFTVTVDGSELTYSEVNDQFVGVLETTKSQDELKTLTVIAMNEFMVIDIE